MKNKFFKKFNTLEEKLRKQLEAERALKEKYKKLAEVVDNSRYTSIASFVQNSFRWSGIAIDEIATIFQMARIRYNFFHAPKGLGFDSVVLPFGRSGRSPDANDDPVGPYFFTSEIIVQAPEDHPAKGRLIMAKADYELYNNLSTPVHHISPCFERYVVCDDLLHLGDNGYIQDFRFRGDFLVPICDQTRSKQRYDVSKDTGYGTLYLEERSREKRPNFHGLVTCRPASWTNGLAITNVDGEGATSPNRIITKDEIKGLL